MVSSTDKISSLYINKAIFERFVRISQKFPTLSHLIQRIQRTPLPCDIFMFMIFSNDLVGCFFHHTQFRGNYQAKLPVFISLILVAGAIPGQSKRPGARNGSRALPGGGDGQFSIASSRKKAGALPVREGDVWGEPQLLCRMASGRRTPARRKEHGFAGALSPFGGCDARFENPLIFLRGFKASAIS